jgi:hypothetical protein
MKVNGFLLFVLLFLGVIVLTSIYSPLRYIRYFLPLIPLVFYVDSGKLAVNKRVSGYFTTFIVFYLGVIFYFLIRDFVIADFAQRFFANAIFLMAPLLYMFFIQPFFKPDQIRSYVLTIFFVNIAVFLYEDLGDLIDVLSDFDIFNQVFITSNILTENHLGYVFGFFVLYFIMQKYSKTYRVIAIIFLILCFKRITLAAVAVCLPTYFLLSFLGINMANQRKKFAILGILINLAYVTVTFLIVSKVFDEFIFEYTGLSTDRFMMGRQQFYSQAFEHAGTVNWFGVGIGKMDDIMLFFYGSKMNLHSEILRTYFEFGFFIFIIWLFILFYNNLFSNKAGFFLAYLNILLLTDNVLVYFDIMFYFYFFILIFMYEEQEKLEKSENEMAVST